MGCLKTPLLMPVINPVILQPILSKAQFFQQKWVQYRRQFHKIAELSWKEEKTLSLIESILLKIKKTHDATFTIHHLKSGIVVDWVFDEYAPFVLFRADVDALPIQEKSLVEYASIHPKVMHACGHDFHIAMLLGAIEIIAEEEEKPTTNLRFVFQRAEETGNSYCGGKIGVQEGILDSVKEVYALHIGATLEKGTFFSRPGILLANTSIIHLTLECSGGHVMHPHEGSNAIDILADLLVGLKGIESRILNPFSQIALVPSMLHAGTAGNIRPNEGHLTLALRNFLSTEELDFLIDGIHKKIISIVKGYPTAKISKFSVEEGYPVLINTEECYEKTDFLLKEHFQTAPISPFFAGEDFSFYLQQRKGVYWILGARNGAGQDHHTADFNPDESILYQGVCFWLLLAYQLKL
jgi:amidohydrolase